MPSLRRDEGDQGVERVVRVRVDAFAVELDLRLGAARADLHAHAAAELQPQQAGLLEPLVSVTASAADLGRRVGPQRGHDRGRRRAVIRTDRSAIT